MRLYPRATLEFRSNEQGRLLAALGEVKGIMTKADWTMIGCFVQRTGRLNTLLDLEKCRA